MLRMDLPADSEVDDAEVRVMVQQPGTLRLFEDAALNVLAEPAAHVRRRRAVRANCGKDGQRCCRHALDVVFAQIPDMEFIVQPKSFDAGMCRGRCPPRYHPAHHHSLLQGLLRRREQRGPRDQHDKQPRVPRPCCAPERLQPLDVLFVDEDNPTKLKLSEWSEMRVVSCSCA
ncbi:hypothetical protein ONE63_009182 [Megalurothrips usitatus]|uniref:TGF-beta family profile domain-containing protein n=1 Tax=Megalurothrips usitatus TaxID=439358 RepID=A0AAV7XMF6_9NEOP|nr:hypothetical protein ONE63_009182 [Megalurothrips usitatus]